MEVRDLPTTSRVTSSHLWTALKFSWRQKDNGISMLSLKLVRDPRSQFRSRFVHIRRSDTGRRVVSISPTHDRRRPVAASSGLKEEVEIISITRPLPALSPLQPLKGVQVRTLIHPAAWHQREDWAL